MTTSTAALCTRNRPVDADRATRALVRTDADEIIVVDQSTDVATRDALEANGTLGDTRVRYIPSDERGAARARNTAIRACTTDIIAFTDDDCEVPTDWTSTIRSHMEANGYGVMFAPVVAPEDRSGLDGWIPEYLPSAGGAVGPNADPIDAFGYSANMSVSLATVRRIGFFDERLGVGSERIPAGEDTDYAYRAYRAGLVVGIELTPAVTHYGARAGEDFDRVRRAYLIGAGAMLDKHRRLGDHSARRRELRAVTDPLAEALSNVVRLRRPSGLGSAMSVIKGAATGRFHYRVDREGRVYEERAR